MKNLTKTEHVLCPKCSAHTYGPYFDPQSSTFFDGFYCEDCGLTWYWKSSAEQFQL